MVQDNPRMNELEQLATFCNAYPYIYIYGYAPTQHLIAKYMVMAQLRICGYMLSYDTPCKIFDNEPLCVVDAQQANFSERERKEFIGIIVSTEDCRYTKTINILQNAGYKNFFFMSEWNKRTISGKMTPRTRENFWFEVNLADHCNLNCQCCDHFAPIAPQHFLDLEQYKRDLARMAELTGHDLERITLLGGEPLLNPQLIDFIEITRKEFPTSVVVVFTDGLLLGKWTKKGGFWEAVKKYAIEVRVTVYPISVDFDPLKRILNDYEIPYFVGDVPPNDISARVWFLTEIGDLNYRGIKYTAKQPFDLSGGQAAFRFISCYQFNESIVLRDGRIYTCPIIPYSRFFNEYFHKDLTICPDDSIDIYSVETFEEIAEFLTHRPQFCRYCAKQCTSIIEWKQSEHSEFEWTL